MAFLKAYDYNVNVLGLFKFIMVAFGEQCNHNQDCSEGQICDLEDRLFQQTESSRICQCKNGLVWLQGQCQGQNNEELAKLLTILIPVLLSVIVTIFIIIACCCWIHSSTVRLRQKIKKASKYEDFELDSNDEAEVEAVSKKVIEKADLSLPNGNVQNNDQDTNPIIKHVTQVQLIF